MAGAVAVGGLPVKPREDVAALELEAGRAVFGRQAIPGAGADFRDIAFPTAVRRGVATAGDGSV